mmetsp:Transcript_22520/g.60298  ORF Transcript_22520/g.60298 Transcript_22520/m.60298 type:complete len:217 (+) Transcript_22520:1132-1782(+)
MQHLPHLRAHEAADRGPGHQLRHGVPDVDGARNAPLLVEKLRHLVVQRAAIARKATLRQPLADKSELGHAGVVVRVVEHLGPEDRDHEGVHLGLVEVLVAREEELLPLLPDEEHELLGEHVNLEDLAVLLVPQPDELQGVLQKLHKASENGQAGRVRGRRIPSLQPPPEGVTAHDDSGDARRDGNREAACDGAAGLRPDHVGPSEAEAHEVLSIQG